LATANAVANTLGTVLYSLGLATAIGLLSLVGAGFQGYAVIVLTAFFGYSGSALLVRALFTPQALGPDDTERPHETVSTAIVAAAKGMIAGARHLAEHRVALYALLAQGGGRGMYGILTIAMLLYAKTLAHGTEFLGLVFVAGAVGALMAAVSTPPATRRWGGQRWLLTLIGVNAVTILVVALVFQPWLLLTAVFVLNVTSMGIKIVVDTALQHECDDDYQGRVFSVNDTAFNGIYVAGLFVGAYLLPSSGRSSIAMIMIVLGYGLLCLWYSFATRVTTPAEVVQKSIDIPAP
jgi:hypothetical protein